MVKWYSAIWCKPTESSINYIKIAINIFRDRKKNTNKNPQIHPNSENSKLQVVKVNKYTIFFTIWRYLRILEGQKTKPFYTFRNNIFRIRTFEQGFVIRYLKCSLTSVVDFFSLLQEFRPLIFENKANRASWRVPALRCMSNRHMCCKLRAFSPAFERCHQATPHPQDKLLIATIPTLPSLFLFFLPSCRRL